MKTPTIKRNNYVFTVLMPYRHGYIRFHWNEKEGEYMSDDAISLAKRHNKPTITMCALICEGLDQTDYEVTFRFTGELILRPRRKL